MIKINIEKAKEITHEKRRAARSAEFAPHDEVIMKQIPGKDMVEAEAARTAIRAKYDVIQSEIDAVETVDDLKTIIDREGM